MSEHFPERPEWKNGEASCDHAVAQLTEARIESRSGLEMERTFMCRCGAYVVAVEQVVLLGVGR